MATDLMIAFLPSDGSFCKQDFPHMTLVHGGPIANRPEEQFNQMAKDAISVGRLMGRFNLCVTGVEQMGEPLVDALMLYPTPQLLLARKLVEEWDSGEFPDFKPHVTIGPAGSAEAMIVPQPAYSMNYLGQALPTNLYFTKIAACWGDKRLIFDVDTIY